MRFEISEWVGNLVGVWVLAESVGLVAITDTEVVLTEEGQAWCSKAGIYPDRGKNTMIGFAYFFGREMGIELIEKGEVIAALDAEIVRRGAS